MTLKIISAQRISFEGEVQSVTLPGEMGLFTVLPRHAALISNLLKGKIVYRNEEGEHEVGIEGGIADVNADVVSVCVY